MRYIGLKNESLDLATQGDLSGGGTPAPYCRIGRNTDSGTANNSLTLQLIGVTTTFEETQSGMADLTNNRIVIQEAGLYIVNAVLTYASSGTGVRRVCASITGGPIIAQSEIPGTNIGTDGQTVSGSSLWRFAVNDSLALYQGQNSGAALNLYGDGTAGKHTYLEVLKVRD
jgi:hypothetical protein